MKVAVGQVDWKMDYNITSSDGLKVSNVFYKGEPIIKDAKLVDWHVNYSNTDGFGYSDAVGCPYFSTAAVIAIEPPQILPIIENGVEVGCILQQNFYSEGWPLPCNYNYCQKFEFYNDGRFRVACASLGRGCGNNGTYRPVIRVSFFNSNQKCFISIVKFKLVFTIQIFRDICLKTILLFIPLIPIFIFPFIKFMI